MPLDSAQRTRIELLAGVIALAIAAIHLYWGIPRFTAQATVGSYTDPRPLAFVLSGHAIALAITLVLLGVITPSRLYLLGIALMLLHLVGYGAWHTVLSHGVVDPTATGHSHVQEPTSSILSEILWNLSNVLEHVVNSPLAFVSKTLELTELGLLGYLYTQTSQRSIHSAVRSDTEEANSPQSRN